MKTEGHIQTFARNLRKASTDVEKLLWQKLRSRQLECLKFRRQQPVDFFIADFICFEKKLIIELDGGQHFESVQDNERSLYMKSQGFKGVLGFWNTEIIENIEGVLERIRAEVK